MQKFLDFLSQIFKIFWCKVFSFIISIISSNECVEKICEYDSESYSKNVSKTSKSSRPDVFCEKVFLEIS